MSQFLPCNLDFNTYLLKNKRIKRVEIQAALGIGETTLSDALTGSHLANRFGPGGATQAEEVIDKLNERSDHPQGKGVLLEFLGIWNKTHRDSISS